MMFRNLATFVTLILIVAFPYWLYLPALFVTIVYFEFYIEALPLAFLVDVLYGARIHPGLPFVFPYAVTALVLILVMIPLRKRLRFND